VGRRKHTGKEAYRVGREACRSRKEAYRSEVSMQVDSDAHVYHFGSI
jgi:hypothetical protein